MRKLTLLICAIGIVALQDGGRAQDAVLPTQTQEGILRLISYNVQFLPGIASLYNKRADPVYRAKEIGHAMANYDLIGLNEVFDEECRDLLVNELRRTFGETGHVVIHQMPPNRKFVTSGGLLIASRRPILESHQMTFSVFSTYAEFGFGADGLASKGVLHARVLLDKKRPDRYLDVFVTHLESRKDAIRPQQVEELAAFIATHSDANHPVIIMGDMNIDGRMDPPHKPGPQYEILMKTLQGAREGKPMDDLWATLYGEGEAGTTVADGKRLDYILLSDGEKGGDALRPLTMKVNPFADSKVEFLSDHSAVEATLTWD